ncbi:NlpC/P60 family protein [Heyndrickxia oleronia]|uniref:coiled-coil domain-containing protein n=1 Tax=Heyndrickxia oleronia TaxID=38875 RepID=UPI00203D1CBC|nr:NlpC/P60 family protein [Heyndrickxia oleronia]MCM3240015.1 NlpC/P60 family protein [Heyndrickxia oleronia]
MKRRLLSLSLASVIGTSGLFTTHSVFAAENLNQKINNKQQEISELQMNEKSLKATVAEINAKVENTNEKMKQTKAEIATTKQESEELKVKIAKTKKRIEERNELLEKRARAMQENGGSSYLDVLLGAESFGDFIDRAMAVTTIVNADQDIVNEQKKDKESLEKAEADLSKKLAKVEKDLKELEDMKVALQYQINDKNSILAKIKEEQKVASNELGELKGQAAKIAEQERAAAIAAQAAKAVQKQAKVTTSSDNSSYNAPPQSNNVTIHIGSGGIETAISVGSSIVGRSPYNWGGGRSASDIANRSFDCSSFVRWAYAEAGVNLGPISGTTTDSLVVQGRAVSASEMKRGDLVFFDTYKRNGHVGIYLGNGTFLNDNSSHGVSIDSMSNSYWRSTFKGVVRRVVE